ncbi:MAG: lecithin retinol acyltransferase family protein [Myxococcaceae bacterium]|nr:lecithin retinol acyltransferase family protein [Myxococcaceae bacterium]MBH2006212.1 lecithin retinol acyltransferase family protein [Myxococcaceae bacterium]
MNKSFLVFLHVFFICSVSQAELAVRHPIGFHGAFRTIGSLVKLQTSRSRLSQSLFVFPLLSNIASVIQEGVVKTEEINKEAKRRQDEFKSLLKREKTFEELVRERKERIKELRRQIDEARHSVKRIGEGQSVEEMQAELYELLREPVKLGLMSESDDEVAGVFDPKAGDLEQPIVLGFYVVPGIRMASHGSEQKASESDLNEVLKNDIMPSRTGKPLDGVSSYKPQTKELHLGEEPSMVPMIIHRPVSSKHYALYIGNGLVVHYFPDESASNLRELSKWGSSTRVRVDTLVRFLDGEQTFFEVLSDRPSKPEETIALALLNLGRANWGLINENCHHLALFCVKYPVNGHENDPYLHNSVDETIVGSFSIFFWRAISNSINRNGNFLVFKNGSENPTRDLFIEAAKKIMKARTELEVRNTIAELPNTTTLQCEGMRLTKPKGKRESEATSKSPVSDVKVEQSTPASEAGYVPVSTEQPSMANIDVSPRSRRQSGAGHVPVSAEQPSMANIDVSPRSRRQIAEELSRKPVAFSQQVRQPATNVSRSLRHIQTTGLTVTFEVEPLPFSMDQIRIDVKQWEDHYTCSVSCGGKKYTRTERIPNYTSGYVKVGERPTYKTKLEGKRLYITIVPGPHVNNETSVRRNEVELELRSAGEQIKGLPRTIKLPLN